MKVNHLRISTNPCLTLWTALDTDVEQTVQKQTVRVGTKYAYELEGDEIGCLLKFMRHAESHTYHKQGLGYAIWKGGGGWEISK